MANALFATVALWLCFSLPAYAVTSDAKQPASKNEYMHLSAFEA